MTLDDYQKLIPFYYSSVHSEQEGHWLLKNRKWKCRRCGSWHKGHQCWHCGTGKWDEVKV
jgi:hypothetical protein